MKRVDLTEHRTAGKKDESSVHQTVARMGSLSVGCWAENSVESMAVKKVVKKVGW